MKFTPKPIAWISKTLELASGGIDCIWNGFTNGREDDCLVRCISEYKQVFVVREDPGIETEADLAGKVVMYRQILLRRQH